MAQVPKNTMSLLFGFGPRLHAAMALITNLLAIATTGVAIASAASKDSLGLGPTNWFLLAIIFFLWGMSFWLSAYFGAKEGYTK